MSETWDSLTHTEMPRGWSDLVTALKAGEKRKLFYLGSGGKKLRNICEEIFSAAGECTYDIVKAFNKAIDKNAHAAETYILACMPKREEEQEEIVEEENPQPEIVETPIIPDQATAPPPDTGEVILGEDDEEYELEGMYRHGNFILLYRSIRRHPAFKNKGPLFRLMFIDLLLDAAFKDHWTVFLVDKTTKVKVFLKRGQYIISMRRISREYEVGEATIRRWVKDLKENEMIDFETLDFKSDKVGAPPGAPPGAQTGAPHDAPQAKIGILVTIRNYDKWQPKIDMEKVTNDAPPGAPPGAPPESRIAPQQNNVLIQKNEFIQNESISEETPGDGRSEITFHSLFKIYEENRGKKLPEIGNMAYSSDYHKIAKELLKKLLEITRGDKEAACRRWEEIVVKASSIHDDWLRWANFTWLAKDIVRCQKILEGSFDGPAKGNDTRSDSSKRVGRGNASDFGNKSSALDRIRASAKVSKSEV